MLIMVDSKIIKRTYKTSSIADIARRINNVAFRRYGFARSEILMHWPEIVGSVLARSSLPERLVMPKKNNQMDFFKWSKNDPLKINKYGIPEPVSSKIFYPDILLVPLVGYDNDLNRLGYGGGFYDRYIEKIEKIKRVIKIGLAFSYQKIKSLPTNQHDKKLDFIITEKEILK